MKGGVCGGGSCTPCCGTSWELSGTWHPSWVLQPSTSARKIPFVKIPGLVCMLS